MYVREGIIAQNEHGNRGGRTQDAPTDRNHADRKHPKNALATATISERCKSRSFTL